MDGEKKDPFAVQEPKVLEFRHRIFDAKTEEELKAIEDEAKAMEKFYFIVDDLANQRRHIEYVTKRMGI